MARKPLFGPRSILNREIDSVETAPESDAIISRLVAESQSKPVTLGRSASGSIPIYFVEPDTPRVPCVMTSEPLSLMAEVFAQGVPIPPAAIAEPNRDRDLVVIELDTNGDPSVIYELWEAIPLSPGPGFSFRWAGRKLNAQFTQARYLSVWDNGVQVEAPFWGVSASGLSVAGGVMMHDDLRAGELPYALQMLVPYARQGVHAYPAQRHDGSDPSSAAAPEGCHMQLDPSKDYSSWPFPLDLMCRAAQKRGVVVYDQIGAHGGPLTGGGISWRVQSVASAGYDSLAGVAQNIAHKFPFHDLRVLPFSLREKPDTTRFRFDPGASSYVPV